MYRKYIKDLIEWKDKKNRKPLIVWGTRQVGKTYLIKYLFAEKFYKNSYIYIDCKTRKDFVSFCESHINAKEVLTYLSLERGKQIDENTLLIFDEAQECLPIITLMKYFCQDFRQIPIIVTGSMVKIKLQRENKKRGYADNGKFLFPVGKINQLTVYPLNFEEYLYNRNKLFYKTLKENFVNEVTVEDYIHEQAMKYFYEYLLIGGMPEVVNEFLESESYLNVKEILKDLYNNFLGDMDLYQASSESIIRSKKIFENIYSQLNKENKNFQASKIENNIKNRELRTPIDWLSLAFLVNKVQLVKEKVTIPLIDSNESLYRLYLSDMGIFTYQSSINPKYFISGDGRNSLSEIFFENYVSIELVNHGYKLFYWKGKNNAEFEFIIESESNIIPIDVKKKRGSLSSLDKFKNHNKLYYAVKISANKYDYDKENKILTLPYYYLSFYLDELLEREIANLNDNSFK